MDNNSTILDILFGAKEILSDKDRWTKGAFTRDVNNQITSLKNNDDHTYCMIGAIVKSTYEIKGGSLDYNFDWIRYNCLPELDKLVFHNTKFANTIYFNDNITTKHKEIIGILDLAIKQRIKRNNNNSDVVKGI